MMNHHRPKQWQGTFFLRILLLLLSMKTTTMTLASPVTVKLNCDPCIARKQYALKVIVHGTSQESFWLQVQSAMKQAALDMGGIQLDLELGRTFDSYSMAQDIDAAAKNPAYDALIVTIPDLLVEESVKAAIQKNNKPVFGMNLGYEFAREIGILGYTAQDEYMAGAAAADEFLSLTNITKALFVKNDPQNNNAGLEARRKGFEDQLPRQVDVLEVNPTDQYSHVTSFQSVFETCEYDAVLLGTSASLDVATSALETNNCLGISILGTFDATPDIFFHIVNGNLAFGISQQPYLQAVLPVYFAALFVTTGKALELPMQESVYLSGPVIINLENIPTDTIQQCQADAFPVCPNRLAPNGDGATCACTNRSQIRIGGVLHGVTTDVFWDPVFASAFQAAKDMGISLDLIRFEPSATNVDIFHRMAARIKILCESGVDGIFVSIPSDIVVESIKRCQELQVPVISVNVGAAMSEELGLLNHIAMVEYAAGYAAAQKLIEAGMVRGYCLDHAPGIVEVTQRCVGFRDGIGNYTAANVTYMGKFDVPLDNKVQYQMIVQNAVGNDGDWAGDGFLLLGTSQVGPYRDMLADAHPAAKVGTFDISSALLAGIESGIFVFGIDQQPFLQGNMPVLLLTLKAYAKQALKNHFVETGPHFVDNSPSKAATICEANFYQVCPDRPPEDMNFITPGFLDFGYTLFCSVGGRIGVSGSLDVLVR